MGSKISTKVRGIIIISAILALVIGITVYIHLRGEGSTSGPASGAALTGVPSIRSTPGVGTPSREYVKLQEKQNLQQAEEALKKRGASVPTLTRSTYMDSADLLPSSISGKAVSACDVEELKKARNAGVTAAELRCKGCSLSALKAAGFTAGELMAAGFTAKDLRAAGFSAKELRDAGFSAKDLADAGFSVLDLKNAGFSAAELKAAGFSAKDLAQAGFSAQELRNAGFSAKDLMQAGFSAKDLKDAGFNAAELRQAGFSDKDLAVAGFTADEIAKSKLGSGNCSVENLRKFHTQNISGEKLKALGCSVAALKAAGFTASELRAAGFSAKDLKDAGFSAKDLKDAGFSAAELKAAGFTASELRAAGFSAKDLKAAGFSAKDLKDAGFLAKDLKDAGFSAAELKAAGFTVGELKQAGFSAQDLKAAGFSAKDLKDAGFSAQDLKNAGFTPAEMATAGFTVGDLLRAGFSKDQVLGALKDGALGGDCSVENLRKLRAQGLFGPALKSLGCSTANLKAAGFTAAELMASGYSAKDLKDAGFSAKDLKDAGFSAADLKNAGFSAKDLKDAGFSAAELKSAGFSGQELKDAGFSAADLKSAGFSAQALKNAGFSDQDLQSAGFSPAELAALVASQDQISVETAQIESPREISAKKAAEASLGSGATSSTVVLPMVRETSESLWQKQLAEMRKQNEKQLSRQELNDQVRQVQQTMGGQAADLFSSWGPGSQQQYVAGQSDQDDKKLSGAGTALSGSEGGVAGGGPSANTYTLKAGTIVFAVLDTDVNSDDQRTPVMATIVSGTMVKAKILGSFQRVEKKLILQFNLLSLPYLTNSMSMNAMAIDQNTARSAIATSVDSHYLLRYGTLFASSFISGLGQAIQTAGSTSTTNVNGSSTNFFPSLNTKEKVLVALGNVGQQLGNLMTPIFNTPPTVEVRAGTGIGILIMSDLAVPKKTD